MYRWAKGRGAAARTARRCATGGHPQNFRAAFELGVNDTSLDSVDADGVALAAIPIQVLNSKLETEHA